MEVTEAVLLLVLGLLVGATAMYAWRSSRETQAVPDIQVYPTENVVEQTPGPYWWWYGLPQSYPVYLSPYWFYDVPYRGPITGSDYYPSPKPWYGGRGNYAPHGPRPGYSGVSVGGGGGGGGGHGGGK
jgi:hypothetical protein